MTKKCLLLVNKTGTVVFEPAQLTIKEEGQVERKLSIQLEKAIDEIVEYGNYVAGDCAIVMETIDHPAGGSLAVDSILLKDTDERYQVRHREFIRLLNNS